MSFDQKSYAAEYTKDHYDRITVLVPHGAKTDLQDYAKANDLSLNSLILKAIERQYHFNFEEYKRGAAE